MTRYLFGLVVAAGLSLGTASDAKAQVAVSFGNPYGGGFSYSSGYGYGGFAPGYGVPGLGYGYVAPRPYVYAPRPFYGGGGYGYAPRVYNYNRGYGGYGGGYGGGYNHYAHRGYRRGW